MVQILENSESKQPKDHEVLGLPSPKLTAKARRKPQKE